ncbi:MAG TPA: hypothetical protein VG937_26285 [Polyangiaceae bacterium]|nr:hypothetical protein [Polyangiaceae bacterium]
MTHYFVFNGDADGLCALQQLRLAEGVGGTLITGVKRDIALLAQVEASAGDACTVLDISLDVNRVALVGLLAAGVSVRYFDHHFAGEVPEHPLLEAHLDPSPAMCTSLLVDRALGGRARPWAVAGAFGDSLDEPATALARAAGLDAAARETLRELGTAINYNAYGETLEDLHVAPAVLAEELAKYESPLAFARSSETYLRLRRGFSEDLARAAELPPFRRAPGTLQFVLPEEPWARRVSGTLANQLAKAHAGTAIALLSPKTAGGYLVSIRVPETSLVSAEGFCRRFPSGGGRRTAAGINHLALSEVERFSAEFEREFHHE